MEGTINVPRARSEEPALRITKVFLSCTGRWTGCDWPTSFGRTGLNLRGLAASQAIVVARATAGAESADWRNAAEWLSMVEAEAAQAECQAREAVVLVAQDRFSEALPCARRAYLLELPYHSLPVWKALHEAVAGALTEASAPHVGEGLADSSETEPGFADQRHREARGVHYSQVEDTARSGQPTERGKE